jgi:hypothetical protein
MSRRAVVISLCLWLVLIAAGLGFYLTRADPPASAPPAGVARSSRPSREPATASPEPEPPVEAAPPARRPAPDAPGAEPAPPPVEAAPTAGTLRIDSDVPGAEVFLDRTFLGVTPTTVPNVAPGSHRLNVTATGYDGHSETIDVAPGVREIRVEFKAIRLDARIRVVHKHRVGSCEGTLSATPDGLRYETSNRDDAFAVALTGLDNFAVNYLDKNLTMKVRNGKTYNFTDSDGSADRLFVFHRDVDKVRARLLKGSN